MAAALGRAGCAEIQPICLQHAGVSSIQILLLLGPILQPPLMAWEVQGLRVGGEDTASPRCNNPISV